MLSCGKLHFVHKTPNSKLFLFFFLLVTLSWVVRVPIAKKAILYWIVGDGLDCWVSGFGQFECAVFWP